MENALKALAQAAIKAQIAMGQQLNTDSHSTFLLGDALDQLNKGWMTKLDVDQKKIHDDADIPDKEKRAAALQRDTNQYQVDNTQMQVETNILDSNSKASSQQSAQDTSNMQGLNTLASSANTVGSYFANIEQQVYG